MARKPKPIAVKRGSRMLVVEVRFWTDALADGKGMVIPKHAWAKGMVYIRPNPAHGIKRGRGDPFNRFADIPKSITSCLAEAKVVLHTKAKAAA